MSSRGSDAEAAVRADVRAWLTAHWRTDRGLVEWRNLLADSGWECRTGHARGSGATSRWPCCRPSRRSSRRSAR